MPASTHETNRWQHAWYPVAFVRDLDPSRPTPFTLMGNDLVLWFERSSGAWRALADVCPHRLVPLSDGRLNAAGELECPYHGWTFNGEGRCTAIPQATEGSSPKNKRDGGAIGQQAPHMKNQGNGEHGQATEQGRTQPDVGNPVAPPPGMGIGDLAKQHPGGGHKLLEGQGAAH